MKSLAGEDIKVYSAWVPILASDAELTVGRATKFLPDSRVMHYWDGNGELVKGFAPVLGLGERPAWDVYLLYDRNAEWIGEPPKPVYWQEQLGISDETQLNGPKLTAQIQKLLAAGKNVK